MRDHPWHNIPIMAGMFGMRNAQWKMEERERILRAMLSGSLNESNKQTDQARA